MAEIRLYLDKILVVHKGLCLIGRGLFLLVAYTLHITEAFPQLAFRPYKNRHKKPILTSDTDIRQRNLYIFVVILFALPLILYTEVHGCGPLNIANDLLPNREHHNAQTERYFHAIVQVLFAYLLPPFLF